MRSPRLLVALGAILTPACIGTFDPALYMRDAGVDASTNETDAPQMDAFIERDASRLEDTGEPDSTSIDARTLDDGSLDGGPRSSRSPTTAPPPQSSW